MSTLACRTITPPAFDGTSASGSLICRSLPYTCFRAMPPTLPPRPARYEALLRSATIDVACIGVGENGHLAFNDPPADSDTNRLVNIVTLDRVLPDAAGGGGALSIAGRRAGGAPFPSAFPPSSPPESSAAWRPSGARRRPCGTRWRGRSRRLPRLRCCDATARCTSISTRNRRHFSRRCTCRQRVRGGRLHVTGLELPGLCNR